MLRLILLRHAKTERDSPSGEDHDRRLDKRGHDDANRIGSWLAAHDPPDRVLVSSAVRARETWNEIATLLPKTSMEIAASLYHAEPAEILQAVRDFAGAATKRLMIVAHNPGLHELALALVAGGDKQGLHELQDNFPTSGAAIISFDLKTWDDVGFRSGELIRFVVPKLLRETPQRL